MVCLCGKRYRDPINILKNYVRSLSTFSLSLKGAPLFEEDIKILLDNGIAFPFRFRPNDHSNVIGKEAADQFAQPALLILVPDFFRYADEIGVRDEDEQVARNSEVRGDAGAFAGKRFLNDLNQYFLI